ncbi:MAG: hypothetical protein MI724_19510, partial [Spirochaetales bacterium]|nr:hypothetical protein [Spirochaetales bacterium]
MATLIARPGLRDRIGGLRLNGTPKHLELYLMLLPAVVYFIVIHYIPMAGMVVAFKNYNIRDGIWGSPWAGFENFRFLILSGKLGSLLFNTIAYNVVFMFLQNIIAIVFAVFITETIGARTLQRQDGPDGSIQHAEIELGGSVVMLGQANEGWPSAPCHIHVYVPDVDATYELALQQGGVSVRPPVRRVLTPTVVVGCEIQVETPGGSPPSRSRTAHRQRIRRPRRIQSMGVKMRS